MASLRKWSFALIDTRAGTQMGRAIVLSGGTVLVMKSGLPERQSLFSKDGSVLAQPVAFVGGVATFYTQTSGAAHDVIDIFGIAPGGQSFMYQGLTDSNLQEINIDASKRDHTLILPASVIDAGVVEFTTGMQLPAGALVSPFQALNVTVLEAARTLSWGIKSTEPGGSATGFGNAVSLAAKAVVPLQSAATTTRGAAIGAATLDHDFTVLAGSQDISVTFSAGSTLPHGYIEIPYRLPFPA